MPTPREGPGVSTMPTASVPATVHSLSTSFHSLADTVLGRNPSQRRAVKRLLIVSHAYVVVLGLVILSIVLGYSPPQAWFLVVYGAVGQVVFYALLRRGVSMSLEDTLFCFPQLLFGISACVIGYALVPFGQGPALEVLFILFVYDLHRLTPRQIVMAATASVILLIGVSTFLFTGKFREVDVLQQVINIGIAIILMPMLSVIGRGVRSVHLTQLVQKVELDKALVELETLSQGDALTGALNRRHMQTLIESEFNRYQRTGHIYSIAMIDIDFFKSINDTYGHAVGDVVLQKLTTLLRQNIRQTDAASRWGGEEFLILMPHTKQDEACAAMDALRHQVEQYPWASCAPNLRVSFSCGVASQESNQTIEHTIERADAALYRAKQHGRNRVASA